MVKSNLLVVQSNSLIEAHYKQTYTVQELRTVLWVISEIHKEDYFSENEYKHKVIQISAKKYAELMNISVKNIYRDAEKIASSLGSKRFTIKTEKGWINIGWISSMEYKHGEGIIEVLIAPAILPYILELKGSHTSFRLENILNLGSSHAIKLYQLLTRYSLNKEKIIELDDLRSILGLSNSTSYLEYKNIKRRILEISKKEINDKTDLLIDYFEIKNGRKVESIKFKIGRKTLPTTIETSVETIPYSDSIFSEILSQSIDCENNITDQESTNQTLIANRLLRAREDSPSLNDVSVTEELFLSWAKFHMDEHMKKEKVSLDQATNGLITIIRNYGFKEPKNFARINNHNKKEIDRVFYENRSKEIERLSRKTGDKQFEDFLTGSKSPNKIIGQMKSWLK